KSIHFFDDDLRCFGELHRHTFNAEGFLKMTADPAKGCSEIVSDRIGHVPHRIHQLLDSIQHTVDIGAEPGKFVVHAGDRDAPAEITGLDLLGRPSDDSDTVFQQATEKNCAADRETQSNRNADADGAPNQLLDFVYIFRVQADNEESAVG